MDFAQNCSIQLFNMQQQLVELLIPVWTNTKACTAVLTNAIESLLKRHGAKTVREQYLEINRQTRRGMPMQGRIDLFATFPDGSCIAIEIDKRHKAWSLAKLKHATLINGASSIWVRWDGAAPAPKYEEVSVLNLTSARTLFLKQRMVAYERA